MKMMKSKIVYAVLILVIIPAIAFVSTNCCHLTTTHGEHEDLKRLHQVATTLNSAIWATYIGETKYFYYIEYATMAHIGGFFTNKPKYTIYRFNKNDLTPEMYKLLWWDQK